MPTASHVPGFLRSGLTVIETFDALSLVKGVIAFSYTTGFLTHEPGSERDVR